MLRIGQIEATAQNDKYTDGNVAAGIPATRLRAAALNAMQEELAGIVEGGGLELDPDDFGQVLKALKLLFAAKTESLGALAALVGAANQLPYFTGTDTAALAALTAAGRDLIGKADVAAMQEYLGVSSGGRLTSVISFTSSGTYTPTAGTKKIRVRIVGGGGGGGGAAATPSSGQVAAGHGASAGSYGETGLIDVTSVGSVVVTVGAKGTTSAGATGTAGGTSSFGSYIIAPGGDGGTFGSNGTALNSIVPDYPHSASCTGSSVLLNIPGEGGRGQFSFASTSSANHVKGGVGGSSFIGKSGGALTTNTVPDPASGYGAGGSGASVTWASGGSPAMAGSEGAPGVVIVEEYA